MNQTHTHVKTRPELKFRGQTSALKSKRQVARRPPPGLDLLTAFNKESFHQTCQDKRQLHMSNHAQV